MLIQKGDENTARKGTEGVILVFHVRAHKENVSLTVGGSPMRKSSRLQVFYDAWAGFINWTYVIDLQHLETFLHFVIGFL